MANMFDALFELGGVEASNYTAPAPTYTAPEPELTNAEIFEQALLDQWAADPSTLDAAIAANPDAFGVESVTTSPPPVDTSTTYELGDAPVQYTGEFQDPATAAYQTDILDVINSDEFLTTLTDLGLDDALISSITTGFNSSDNLLMFQSDEDVANRAELDAALQGASTPEEAWTAINSVDLQENNSMVGGTNLQDLKFEYLTSFYDQSGTPLLAPIDDSSRVTAAIPTNMTSDQFHDYADQLAMDNNLFPDGSWGANTRGFDDEGRLILDAERDDGDLFSNIITTAMPMVMAGMTGAGLTTALTPLLGTAGAAGAGAAGGDLITQAIGGESYDPLQTLQAGVTAPITDYIVGAEGINAGPGVETGFYTGVTQEAIDQAFEGDLDLVDLGLSGLTGATVEGGKDALADTFQTGDSGMRLQQEMMVDPRYSHMVHYDAEGRLVDIDQEFWDVFDSRYQTTDFGKLVGPDSLLGGDYWPTEPIEDVISVLSKPLDWAAQGLDAFGLLEPISDAFDSFAAAFPNEEAKTFQDETARIDAGRAQAQLDFDNGIIGGNEYDDLMAAYALDMDGVIDTYYQSTIRYDERFLTNWEDERSEDSVLFGIWEDNPYIDGHTPPGTGTGTGTGTEGGTGTGTEGALPSVETGDSGVLQTIVDAVWGDSDDKSGAGSGEGGSTGEGGGLPGGGQEVIANADVQGILDDASIDEYYGSDTTTVPTDGRTDNEGDLNEGGEEDIVTGDGEDVIPEDVIPENVIPEDVIPEDVIPEDVIPEFIPDPEEPFIPDPEPDPEPDPLPDPEEPFIPEDELPEDLWQLMQTMFGMDLGIQGGSMMPVNVGSSPLAAIEMLRSPYANKTEGIMGGEGSDQSAMIKMILNAYQNTNETEDDKLDKILKEMQRVA